MNTLILRPLSATLLVAASLGATPAYAQGLRVGDAVGIAHFDGSVSNADDRLALSDRAATNPLADEWSVLGRVGVGPVNRDLSGWDMRGNALELELGPQYKLNDKVSVGGEWERFQPYYVHGHPDIDQYTFGARVSF